MHLCPVCAWPLHSPQGLKTHMETNHSGMTLKYLTVKPHGNEFKMQLHSKYPKGKWLRVGQFWRKSDNYCFIVVGQGIYAGEVGEKKLSDEIAEFLGLGKRIL